MPRETTVLFEDETDLRLFPPLRAGWRRRGQPLEVRLSGGNAKGVVFGALHIRTGHRLLLPRQGGAGADFRRFLHYVRTRYRRGAVVMLLDEDRSHTAADSVKLAEQLHVELLWLPKRCPELNGLEALWGDGKDHVCVNRQYATIDEETGQFMDYLLGLARTDALRKAGLLSDDWWLSK